MQDDFKNNFLPQLEKSLIYQKLKEEAIEKDPDVLNMIHNEVAITNSRKITVSN